MKKHEKPALAIFLSLCLLVFAGQLIVSAPCQAASEPSFLIQQNSAKYGTVTALVNCHNFRMDAMGMKLYMKAPFKTLAMYGNENKMRFACGVDHLGNHVNLRSLSDKEKKAGKREVVTDLGPKTFAGFKCSNYLFEHVSKTGKREKKAEIWTTTATGLPKDLEIACAKLTDCPAGYGLPVKIFSYQDGHQVQMLETFKIERKDFSPRVFVEPSNYKPARDEFEMMMEDGSGSQF